ncbi:bifunctional 2-polyprenyl-6-hydroxyphenol methylase/3-demethylubiquinol 3-O-methyltransferase UbiG [Synechococcus sp. UW179B]|uniref:class I SAM-dependent methyltransferase n=1 Tax=Synechococcus sp. UW179B TaxID=2575516 RepID=UPI000E0E7039|nr:class I SAM-dependent methyltransferase [Synechococcus sp. UW179B]
MQEQVSKAFDKLWNQMYDRDSCSDDELGITNDNMKLVRWSNDLITKWVSDAISARQTFSILDVGCGGGYGFKSILELNQASFAKLNHIEYVGVDLIDLNETKKNLDLFLSTSLPNVSYSIELLHEDMNTLSTVDQFDLVIALGSLHHTPSVSLSLQSTYRYLKSDGTYIGWIINDQKPLRRITDTFFRDFFNDAVQQIYHDQDLSSLSLIFKALGEALEDKTISIDNRVTCLDLDPGTYKLQTLLYDYFMKCYFKSGDSTEGLTRIKAQIFDWFAPQYYHQTSRNELIDILTVLPASVNHCIVTKTNGHFFKFDKGIID